MAISKITYKASPSATPETWMDATGATAAASDITSPKTAMLADGVVTTGTGGGGGNTNVSQDANGYIVVDDAVPSGGTDFTAEWQRPSDWPTLPNDIGTYAGQYFLYKIETGKTVYRVRVSQGKQLEVGVTDASGNFTAIQTIPGGERRIEEIDISNLQFDDYFWLRCEYMALGINRRSELILEPVVESIVSNTSNQYYEETFGTVINTRTLHFIAVNWTSDYKYNFYHTQNKRVLLQCVEFHGGSWSREVSFPLNCNKIVIDDVNIIVNDGHIFGDGEGRGNSIYAYADYTSISIGSQTALRMNFLGGSTAEAQSILNKLGDLSGVNRFGYFWQNAFKVTQLDFTGNKITNATDITYAFNSCQSLQTIIWGETDLSGIASLQATFDGDECITNMSLPGTSIHINQNNGMQYAFRNCEKLQTLDLSNIDYTNNVAFGYTFSGCLGLKNLTFKADAGIAQAINLSDSEQLTVASLLSLFNALATVTTAKTCTIGATNLAKLTAAEKAIATNKGWTLT